MPLKAKPALLSLSIATLIALSGNITASDDDDKCKRHTFTLTRPVNINRVIFTSILTTQTEVIRLLK